MRLSSLFKWLAALFVGIAVLIFATGVQHQRYQKLYDENTILQRALAERPDYSAVLSRIEALASATAEDAALELKFVESIARSVAETKNYARGAACLSALTFGAVTGFSPNEAFEYFVLRPDTDCVPEEEVN